MRILLSALVASPAIGREIKFSTYVGGHKADGLFGAAVLPNGSVVVGGTFDASRGGRKGRALEGGRGVILLLDAEGRQAAERSFPGSVTDLDADDRGYVYATGSFGSAKVDSSLARTLWTNSAGGPAARTCPGPDGGAVVLADKRVTVVDGDGRVGGKFRAAGGYVNDVAYDRASKLVIVGGFDNKKGQPPGQKRYPVQVAFVRAYSLAGEPAWNAYGWKGQEVADRRLMADTRVYRTAIGADGKLYIAGESAGGNTIWTRSAQGLDRPAKLVKGDEYQHAYNTAANHITAVVRMDPKTGKSEIATLLLARLSSGRGNAIRPRAIAADAHGNILLGGTSAFSPPKSAGSFGAEGGGAFFVIFDGHLNRSYATTLAAGGTTQALAVGSGVIVAAGDCRGGLVTFRPQKDSGDSEGDGFAVVLSSGSR